MEEKKILLIEDDIDWLNQISDLITDSLDVVIESYTSFIEAERRLLQSNIDFHLLITDIYPSETSRNTKGLKFLELVRKTYKIPVIIITGESSIVKQVLRDYKVDVFDKGDFELTDFINTITKFINAKPLSKKSKTDKIFTPKYVVKQINLNSTNNLSIINILIFQFRTVIDDWKVNNGLYFPYDDFFFKDIIWKVFEKVLLENISLVVFPELTVPASLVEPIKEWSKKNKDILIIGGSHYSSYNEKIVSKCPVFLNGKVYYTDKIYPSPNELSAIHGHGLNYGQKIIYFVNSFLGNFFVLICADFLKVQEIRAEILKHKPDFIIVPAFQKDSNDYFMGMSDTVNNANDMYCIYSNNTIDGYADGKSAFFGIVRTEVRDELIKNDKTDFKPKGKISELKTDENYSIIQANIFDKNPAAKRKVGDAPNVKISTGKI